MLRILKNKISGLKTYFNYTTKGLAQFPGKTRIRRFIELLFKKERITLKRINYIFCDDEFLLHINKSFLKHDFYTDIITFNLSEDDTGVIGEVYISTDRIKENAKTFDVTTKEEFLRVIIHGALHLCGYKDKKKSEIRIIRNKENEYLFLFIKFK